VGVGQDLLSSFPPAIGPGQAQLPAYGREEERTLGSPEEALM
jgi:hypothetical protein